MPKNRGGELLPFFGKSSFIVTNKSKDSYKYPKVEITTSQKWVVALRLAKEGYFYGNPEVVMKAKVGTVLKIMQYETFTKDYESKFIDLNKADK